MFSLPKKLELLVAVGLFAGGIVSGCFEKKVQVEQTKDKIEITEYAGNWLSVLDSSRIYLSRDYNPQTRTPEKDWVFMVTADDEFSYITYGISDGANERYDGVVDYLDIERKNRGQKIDLKLTRKNDYQQYKSDFDLADKILAETKEHFKEQFKSKL